MSGHLRLGCLAGLAMLIWALSPASGADPVKYKLAYKFQSGQVFTYDVKQQTEMTTQCNETSESTKNTADFRRHFKVLKINDDGSAELETTIDWVRMHVTFNDDEKSTIVFKSDDPKFHHPKFKHLLNSFGKPQAVVQVSPSGKTIKVTPTATANSVVAAKPEASESSSTALSPEGYLMRLPETELAIGEVWTERCIVRVVEDKLNVKIDMLRTCTLKKVENGIATLQFRVAVITPGTSAHIKAQLIQREPVGQFLFDLNRGVVIGSESGVDGRVVGPFEGKGSMQAVSSFKERLVAPNELAEKPTESTIK